MTMRTSGSVRWRQVAGWALLMMVAGAACPAADLNRFESQHYEIATNVERELASEVARHMDAMFEDYARRLASFRVRNHQQMPLYLFQEEQQYHQFMGGHGIEASNTGGMFFVVPSGSGLATFAQQQSRYRMYRVLQHEGWHQFAFARISDELPIWANEGMAEYFGDAILSNGRLYTGQVDPYRLKRLQQAIADGTYLPFNELLGMTSEQWRGRITSGHANSSLLYDQAWSIVHFLVNANGGKYKEAFIDYLMRINQGSGHWAAFTKAFGANGYQSFEQAWKRYVQQLEPDPLSETILRLQFLAQGLKMLHERNESVGSMAELKQKLQRLQFRVARQENGITMEMSSIEDDFFQAPRINGRWARMQVVKTSDPELPPEIHVTGTRPAVQLTWRKTPEGQLIDEIVFR